MTASATTPPAPPAPPAPPTVDALVALAHRILAQPETSLAEVRELARGVSDLLASGDDCGWERPMILEGKVCLPESWAADVAPDDACAIARMIFRYADGARVVADHLSTRETTP